MAVNLQAFILVSFLSLMSPLLSEAYKSKGCSRCPQVIEILGSMRTLLEVLNDEVCTLRREVNQNCSSSNTLQTAKKYMCLIEGLEYSAKGKSVYFVC